MSSRKPVAYQTPYYIRGSADVWELVGIQEQAPLYVMRQVGGTIEKWVKETEIVDVPATTADPDSGGEVRCKVCYQWSSAVLNKCPNCGAKR